jgi:hypothetical protein
MELGVQFVVKLYPARNRQIEVQVLDMTKNVINKNFV